MHSIWHRWETWPHLASVWVSSLFLHMLWAADVSMGFWHRSLMSYGNHRESNSPSLTVRPLLYLCVSVRDPHFSFTLAGLWTLPSHGGRHLCCWASLWWHRSPCLYSRLFIWPHLQAFQTSGSTGALGGADPFSDLQVESRSSKYFTPGFPRNNLKSYYLWFMFL